MSFTRTLTVGALALATVAVARPAQAQDKDIVETAVAAGQFTTLAKLLGEAGLVETLKGPGPFTVFAPTDEAFAKVPKPVLERLLADKEQLKKVLTYHVVAGRVMAADVKAGSVETVAGVPARITIAGDKVKIDAANVVKTDIVTSNGVIHVIDRVILPNGARSAAAAH